MTRCHDPPGASRERQSLLVFGSREDREKQRADLRKPVQSSSVFRGKPRKTAAGQGRCAVTEGHGETTDGSNRDRPANSISSGLGPKPEEIPMAVEQELTI